MLSENDNYEFRNANERELEALCTKLVEDMNFTRQDAERTVGMSHVGILEGYGGEALINTSKILVVIYDQAELNDIYAVHDYDNKIELKRIL